MVLAPCFSLNKDWYGAFLLGTDGLPFRMCRKLPVCRIFKFFCEHLFGQNVTIC